MNRNTVPGDASALSPGGVRIGAPAMTTRGCTTEDFKMIADFLHRCASIALELGVGLKFRRDRRGSPQVLQVYFAALRDSLVTPHSRVMGLGLPSGGHLIHGYYTAKRRSPPHSSTSSLSSTMSTPRRASSNTRSCGNRRCSSALP